jgi:hypothetical protein
MIPFIVLKHSITFTIIIRDAAESLCKLNLAKAPPMLYNTSVYPYKKYI